MLRSYHLAILSALTVGIALPPVPAWAGATGAAFPPQDATLLTVTKPDEAVSPRTFLQPNETQWFKIVLKQDQDYAFLAVFVEEGLAGLPALTVYNQGGKQLLTFQMTDVDSSFVAGSEFHARETGTYYIKAVNGGPDSPVTYYVDVELDCREGAATRCKLAAGQEVGGYFNFTDDKDWRRVAAKAGRRYTVVMTVGISGSLAVMNRQGKTITTCSADCLAKFKAAYTGPYYVVAGQEDEDSADYKLRLTSP